MLLRGYQVSLALCRTLGFTEQSQCLQVRPLRRQLKGLKAWVTGQRKDQSPGTRASVPVVQASPPCHALTAPVPHLNATPGFALGISCC